MATNDRHLDFGPRDSTYVGTDFPEEFAYWLNHFEVTPSELREAVQKVGHNVKDVEFYLNHWRNVEKEDR